MISNYFTGAYVQLKATIMSLELKVLKIYKGKFDYLVNTINQIDPKNIFELAGSDIISSTC